MARSTSPCNAHLTDDIFTNNRLNARVPLSKTVALGNTDSLKVILTAKDNGKAKRPHQAFVVLKEQDSGLETPFPLVTKESGKGAVTIVRIGHKTSGSGV